MRKYLLFILLPFIIYAQDAQSILNEIQLKFNSINNFSADFRQSNQAIKEVTGLSGKFYFKKKNKYRIELSRYVIVSNDTVLWNFDNKLNRVVINGADNKTASFSLNDFVINYPGKCTIRKLTGNSNFNVIELKPNSKELGFKSARIYSDKNNLIRKLSITGFNNKNLDFEFSNIRINESIPESKFYFIPPEGTQIIDLR